MDFKSLANSPIWDDFQGKLSLDEMGKVKLMNRIDTKFVMPSCKLEELLMRASSKYFVQKTEGKLISQYDTIYYDTELCDYYIMHHNKRRVRQKLRTRVYVDSGISFIEIKNKNNKGRTKKKRIGIGSEHLSSLSSDSRTVEFLKDRLLYPIERLSPNLRTSFNRITLVNTAKTERVTIDMGLTFENLRNGNKKTMPGIAIVEIKQDGTRPSQMKEILTLMHIHRMGFSKYCIGTALTTPTIKQNNFKEKLVTVKNIEKNAQFITSSTGI